MRENVSLNMNQYCSLLLNFYRHSFLMTNVAYAYDFALLAQRPCVRRNTHSNYMNAALTLTLCALYTVHDVILCTLLLILLVSTTGAIFRQCTISIISWSSSRRRVTC
jgi:hypothetical protein